MRDFSLVAVFELGMWLTGKWNRDLMLCGGVLIGVLALNENAEALALGNPYVGIVTNRNLFQLKSPELRKVDTPQPPPLRDIKVSGITTLPDATRAILRVMSAAKPPEPAKEVSLFLTAGATEEGVQVLDIDVAHGLVKISNAGTLQTLDITKNVPKANAPPSAAANLPVPHPQGT